MVEHSSNTYTPSQLAVTEVVAPSEVRVGDYFWSVQSSIDGITAYSSGRRIEAIKAVRRDGELHYEYDCEGRIAWASPQDFVRIQKRGLAWQQIQSKMAGLGLPIPPIPEIFRDQIKIQGEDCWSSLPYLELEGFWQEEGRFDFAFGAECEDFFALELVDDNDDLGLKFAVVLKPIAFFLRWNFEGLSHHQPLDKYKDGEIHECMSMIDLALSDAAFIGSKNCVWYAMDVDDVAGKTAIIEVLRHGTPKAALDSREIFDGPRSLKDFWLGVRPTILVQDFDFTWELDQRATPNGRIYLDEGTWAIEFETDSNGSLERMKVTDTTTDQVVVEEPISGQSRDQAIDAATFAVDTWTSRIREVTINQVMELTKQLDENPLFHFSLNSKELFHSNFLAWYFDRYPSLARHVFTRWSPLQPGAPAQKCLREYKNLDLVVQPAGLAPVVVENKVLSLPDTTQLEEYAQEKIGNFEKPTLLLLSVAAPGWSEGQGTYSTPSGHVWKYVSYIELADALDSGLNQLIFEDGGIDNFEVDLLRRYIRMIRDLHRLFRSLAITRMDQSLTLTSDVEVNLKSVRLDSVIRKLRANSAAQVAMKFSPSIAHGKAVEFAGRISHGESLVEGFATLPNGDRLGWQLQGSQFRLAVTVASQELRQRTETAREKRHEYVAEHYADWFDFGPFEQTFPALVSQEIPEREANGGFYRFDPGFVYRYRRCPELLINDIAQLSSLYLYRAAEWPKH